LASYLAMFAKAGLVILLFTACWSCVSADCDLFDDDHPIHLDFGTALYNVSELVIAIHEDNATLVRDLIQQGCDINYADISMASWGFWVTNMSVLHVATMMASNESLEVLLEFPKLDVNARDSDGDTPMFQAAGWGIYSVVIELYNKGADVNAKNKYNMTPLTYAASGGHYTTVLTLIELGADIDVQDNEYGETPLMASALEGYTDVIKILIENGADVNAKNYWNETALHYAAVSDSYTLPVLTLIELGADIDAQDRNGETPLIWSAQFGNKDEAKILIEKGADVNLTDSDGWTALDYALLYAEYQYQPQKRRQEYLDIEEMLLAAGAEEGAGQYYTASGSGSGDYHDFYDYYHYDYTASGSGSGDFDYY